MALADALALGAIVALIGAGMTQSSNRQTISKAAALEIVERVNGELGGWHDPREVMALIQTESDFNARAVSSAGAYGLMQLLPTTAADMGYSGRPEGLFDPETNIRLGMRYLIWIWNFLTARLGREPTYSEWLSAYNGGVGNVLKGWRNSSYVDKIVARTPTYG